MVVATALLTSRYRVIAALLVGSGNPLFDSKKKWRQEAGWGWQWQLHLDLSLMTHLGTDLRNCRVKGKRVSNNGGTDWLGCR